MRVMTVGELRDVIRDLPDDTPVIGYQSDMERSGYQKAVDARPSHMVSEKRETYDAFDYTPYIYEVFTPSKDGSGTLCLIIN